MAAKYSSGQDYMSAAKLNYFHYVLKQLTGYTLHPIITVASQPKAIADLGTQTAVWAIDVAEHHKVEVDAFDLSDKFIPPLSWLPSNVTFKIHDIRTPLPDEAQGKYDVVHFRLFLTLSSAQLREMLATAFTLLRPGGYVQWTEHDKTDLKPITASAGAATDAVEAFIDVQQNPFPGYNARWVRDIAPAMATVGLEVVAEDYVQTRFSMLPQVHELHLLSLMDVPPGLSSRVDEFKDKHFDTLAQDHTRGVALMDGFICVIGRKPGESKTFQMEDLEKRLENS